ELFTELSFTRFLKDLPPPAGRAVTLAEGTEVLVDVASLRAFCEGARAEKRVGLEILTTSADAMRGFVVGVGLAAGGRGAYVPIGHLSLGAVRQVKLEEAFATLSDLLSDPTV